MTTFLMPVVLWMVTGVVTWLAGRYHLDVNQQQQVSADIMGGAVWVGGFAVSMWHLWRVRLMPPPNGGTNVQTPVDKPYGSQPGVGNFMGRGPTQESGGSSANPGTGPSH